MLIGKGLSGIRLRDILIAATAAATLAVVLRVFVLGTFSIPSHSMENTLLPGDQILVSKVPHWFQNSINRGDVVVFTLPDSIRGDKPDEAFIKRVIGLPGDTIGITAFGITINNHIIPDPPLSASTQAIDAGRVSVVVPPRHYFVLGDNRGNSWDSRYWGALPESCIVGVPLVVYWSKGDAIRWKRIFTAVE